MNENLRYLRDAENKIIDYAQVESKDQQLLGWLAGELLKTKSGKKLWKDAVDGIFGKN